jgi:hypothetical protein
MLFPRLCSGEGAPGRQFFKPTFEVQIAPREVAYDPLLRDGI